MQIGRREAVAVIIGLALVVAAFVVPHLHLGSVTPLINSTAGQIYSFADTAPIFGWWNAHVGWGTVPAIVIAVAAVWWGPTLAQRLPWRTLPVTAWAVSCVWAFSLAMSVGPLGPSQGMLVSFKGGNWLVNEVGRHAIELAEIGRASCRERV